MALVITVAGVPRTPVINEDTIRITQLADTYTFTAELEIFDENSDISITAGSRLVADEITIVDGATTYFGGYVTNQDITTFLDGPRKLSLQCQGYGILLNETVVASETYAAEADDAIIDDLFNTYLAAIDSVTHVAQLDASMDIEFSEMSLAEIMDALCERTGGRWYIDNVKALHYFADENDDCGFDLSDTPNNVTSFPYHDDPDKRVDGTQIVNRVRVVGADGIATTRNDGGSQGTYGIRAVIITDTSLTTTTELEERGDAILLKYKDPKITYVVRTAHGGAVAGQEVDLKCVVLGLAALTTFTIRELYIYWELGEPVYEMVLGEAEVTALQRATSVSGYLRSVITNPPLPLSARGWGHDLVFSATDHNTVAWTGGTITTAGGVGSFSIDAGNTGDMAATTYVFLDINVSLTVLQTDGSVDNAIGGGKILVAVCEDVAEGDKDATFKVFGGGADGLIVGDHVAANSIRTGHIVTNAIVTAHINDIAVTGSKIAIGDQGIFSAADGKLLLGPGCELTATSWKSLRGQEATIGGAFQTRSGSFPGTQGIVMEPGCTNLITNPSIEVDTTGYTTAGTNTIARSDEQAKYEDYSLKCTCQDSSYLAIYAITLTAALHYASCWIWVPTSWNGGNIILRLANFAGASYVADREWNYLTGPRNTWFQLVSHITPLAGDLAGHVQLFVSDVPAAGRYVYADGWQTEISRLTTTAIGSMPWCSWSGAAHGSTSVRVGTTMTIPTAGNISASIGSIEIWFRISTVHHPGGGYLFSAGDVNAEFDAYVDPTAGDIIFKINGATRCSGGAAAPDLEHCAIFTWDVAGNVSQLFVDGVLTTGGSKDVAGAPTLHANMSIGYSIPRGVAYNLCGVVTEYAVFGDLLTANEAAAIFNLRRATVDHGAIDAPGIYITDGKFRISSSTSGSRIEITPEMVAGYSDLTTKQFWLQASDGKAYAGAGKVLLDVDGISITAPSATVYQNDTTIKWVYSGSNLARIAARRDSAAAFNYMGIYVEEEAGRHSWLDMAANAPAGQDAVVQILASGAGTTGSGIKIENGPTYGHAVRIAHVSTVLYTYDIVVTGGITATTTIAATGAVSGASVAAVGAVTAGTTITATGALTGASLATTGGIATDTTFALTDGIAAPGVIAGMAVIYVDVADGNLKVKFSNGFVQTIAADS